MSSNVTVTMELTLKAEAVEPFRAQVGDALVDTRSFPGFVDLSIHFHADDPNRILFLEEWKSRADYEAYVAFRTETGMMDVMAAMLVQPPRIDIWDKWVP